MLGWLLAVVLAFVLSARRRELRRLRAELEAVRAAAAAEAEEKSAAEAASAIPVADSLAVLRLELARLAAAGELGADEHQRLSAQIDAHWQATLARTGIEPGAPFWRRACAQAWMTLAAHGLVPYAPRPWEPRAAPESGRVAPGEPFPALTPAGSEPRSGVRPARFAVPTARPSAESADPEPAAVTTLNLRPAALEGGTPAAETGSRSDEAFALRQTEPTAIERALRAVTGWPRLLLPFLVQNVGWFIGGFLFLAGSVFLVSYTAGFARSLAVFAALFAYTGALLWGGYQIRRRRPALTGASDTLLTLGMLLAPLVLAAAARLLLAAGANGVHMAVALAGTTATLGAFLFAAQVVSGVTDRALQGTHPRVYLTLAAVQLALPLLAVWPAWPVLAAVHLLLLGLLTYGITRYARSEMRAIFVDRRKVAFFAAGTLVYAALVSFVHLTWGTGPTALPRGYYGPYLMAACGLLFYLDGAFKAWADGHLFLSRFSFVIYGLSVVAVLLAIEGPGARLLTLGLGAVLYGAVAWHYLTRVPVYLLLASAGGLYALLVLDRVPGGWWFIAALPALAGLLALSRWLLALAARRPAALPLALTVYRLLFGLAFALAGWSLAQGRPGLVGMVTGALLAALAWRLLAVAPGPLIGRPDAAETPTPANLPVNLREGPWLYAVVLAVSAAVAYAPPWPALAPGVQAALGLVLLAWPWTWLAARPGRQSAQVEVYANSALLSIGAGLALAVTLTSGSPGQKAFLAMTCALTAGPLLGLSLGLCLRAPFYGFLAATAAAAALAKAAFFPGPSTGAALLLAGLGVASVLWWVERQPPAPGRLRLARIPRPLTLLWVLPVRDGPPAEPEWEVAPEGTPAISLENARV